jgi:anti-sigma B factor antagonist
MGEARPMDQPWRELPLSVDDREDDGVLVIEARGELDLATAPRLAAHLDRLRRTRDPTRVLVDLTAVEFCDSTGLRALLGAAAEVRAAGGKLAICAGDGAVARLLAITGAEEWLEIHPDASAAHAALVRR